MATGCAVALALAIALTGPGPAAAHTRVVVGRASGVMPHHARRGKVEGSFPAAQPPLEYFGGPVLHANETFVVFWDPAGDLSQGYRDLVTRYLKDVAAASGSTDNVYSVINQYYDESGPVRYESTFGGAAVDANPFPTGGCAPSASFPVCMSEQEFAEQLHRFIAEQGIATNPNRLFMVLTAPGVNTCFGDDETFCTSNAFCAYHSDYVAGQQSVMFANLPYTVGTQCDDPRFHPNGSAADPVIFTLTHEQLEMITDPLIDEAGELAAPIAWLNPEYGEAADKCEEWTGPTRSNGVGKFNQVVNGHKYMLPAAWSNVLGEAEGFGCVLNGNDRAPVPDFSAANTRGHTLTVDGRLSTDPDPGDSISAYHWHFGDGTVVYGPAKMKHRYAAPGTYTVELLVSDQAGAVAGVQHQVTVG